MNQTHWTEQKERAGTRGIGFFIKVMKLTGPRFVKLLVVPVALYYFLSSPTVRKVSGDYLSRLQRVAKNKGLSIQLPGGNLLGMTLRHILSFAWSMVDRIYVWSKGLDAVRYQIEGRELFEAVTRSKHQGALFLTSHLGNFDLAIALCEIDPTKRFNVVLQANYSRIYNQFRKKIYASDQVRFIDPQDITPIETIDLTQRAANGEVIIISADRTLDAHGKHNMPVDFLGEQAAFPAGPYILAHFLEVPIYSLFAIQKRDVCLIKVELFEQKITLPRQNRQTAIKQYVQKFAARLERECFDYPLQWYNFYDFWENPDSAKPDK